MPINHLLQNQSAFGPEEITVLVGAFEDALRQLRMSDRTDAITDIIAKRIIELGAQGERNRARLTEGALKSLSR